MISKFIPVYLATFASAMGKLKDLRQTNFSNLQNKPACFPDTYYSYDWSFVPSGSKEENGVSHGVWYLYGLEPSNWDQSVERCASIETYSYIASIRSQQEQDGLATFLKLNNPPNCAYWLGGISFSTHTKWYWFSNDDAITPMDYTNWWYDYPKTDGDDCAYMSQDSSNSCGYSWSNGYGCATSYNHQNIPFGYICEIRC